MEKELAEQALNLESTFFGITAIDLRKFAVQLTEKNKLQHHFIKEKRIAGKKWYYKFMKDNPCLSLFTPEVTSMARAKAFNKECVYGFFDKYKFILDEYKFTANQIYNVNETELSTVHKPSKIIAQNGIHQVGALISGEKGLTATDVYCMNAAGEFIPHVLIFKSERRNDCLKKGAPPGTVFGCSKNGWITGERVMGLSPKDGVSTVIPNNLFFMWKIPDDWTMKDAATVTCVYATVIYALCMRGNVKRGERILIHSGTGGVGLAAINISLHYGLEIFTTVGTQKKRDYLKKHFPTIPDDHIGYSRDLSFQEMINLGTNGQGVDLVLNSLAENKLLASVRCLAQGGRFLEIGKFDIINDNDLVLELMNLERSYHGVMLDEFCNASDNEKKCLVDLVQDFLDKRIIKPLDRTIFEEDEIEKAIRFMMTGKHIGKVVLKLREEENLNTVPNVDMKIKSVIPRYTSDPEKVSIILGGLGGFGLELTDWLVLRGARKIVLTSRYGIKTGYQKYRIRIWRSYGCEINISTEDITTKYGCEQLVAEAQKLGPIQSIFNSALILEDEIFDNQSVEKFRISLAPKAYATKYLDKITRTRCRNLRDFVVFSSITCGRGNARQTNYGMANSIMERICERRKQDGYPGLAIQWGAIGDVGVIAESQEKDQLLEFIGTLQQRITSCLNVMDTFLKQSNPVVSSMIVAQKRTSLFSTQNLLETVGNVLGIKDINVVSSYSTLSELGMDSMLALEMKQTLENGLQIILTSQEIRDMTFSRLKKIQEQFTTSTEHGRTI